MENKDNLKKVYILLVCEIVALLMLITLIILKYTNILQRNKDVTPVVTIIEKSYLFEEDKTRIGIEEMIIPGVYKEGRKTFIFNEEGTFEGFFDKKNKNAKGFYRVSIDENENLFIEIIVDSKKVTYYYTYTPTVN